MTRLTGKAEHDSEFQPTRDFVDKDGTMTAALLEYLNEPELPPELLWRAEQT